MATTTIQLTSGQGVYRQGDFFTEYPADKEVYIEHILSTAHRARAIRADLTVFTGGPTSRRAKGLTEAGGMRDLTLRDFGSAFRFPCAVEGCALCSGENLLFGMMEARRQLSPSDSIGQVWLWTAWTFKRARFTLIARALGISDQFYFSAFSDSPAAGAKALNGERNVVDYMGASGDFLLLGDGYEVKRQQRYNGDGPYEERLATLKQEFPAVFNALAELRGRLTARNSLDLVDYLDLQKMVRYEILDPKPAQRS